MGPQAPDKSILDAFDIRGTPEPLNGGRGLCYCLDGIVLRPSEDYEEAQWVAELTNTVPSSPFYRISQPRSVIYMPDLFVHNGWTASLLLDGTTHPSPDFEEILAVTRSFHEDLRRLQLEKPPFLTRSNRWRGADLVTWREKSLVDVQNVNQGILEYCGPVLKRLEGMLEPLPQNLQEQVIHGDMTGNVLFQDGKPPAIIDITPYWRPAQYAEAIVVADALAWYGKGEETVRAYGVANLKLQLLVRALYWRYLTFTIDSDLGWVQAFIAKADYAAAAEIVHKLLTRP